MYSYLHHVFVYTRKRKSLQQDVNRIVATIKENPVSKDQFVSGYE
jgi:hypothetical protein